MREGNVATSERRVTEAQALGEVIRGLRQARGLSLRDLSKRSGLSVSFLSLVERGLSSPALTSLSSLAKALDTGIAAFFEQQPGGDVGTGPHMSHAGEDAHLTIASSGRTYQLLSGRSSSLTLEPLFVTIPPGQALEEPYSHEGEEFAYMLSGTLLYRIDGREYRLHPGDSIHFKSTVPHAIYNDSDGEVEAIWVCTPRLF